MGEAASIQTALPDEWVRRLHRTNVEELFSITRTAEETAPKPNPDMLEEIGLFTDIPKERTLMVGDTVHDIVMAQRYGCDVAAISGVFPREERVRIVLSDKRSEKGTKNRERAETGSVLSHS